MLSLADYTRPGLFAPRAGQHYRDEQRRRKSQFDRGTRLAEMEEQEFEFDQFDVGGMGMTYYDSFADAPYEAQYQAYARAQTCKFEHCQF